MAVHLLTDAQMRAFYRERLRHRYNRSARTVSRCNL